MHTLTLLNRNREILFLRIQIRTTKKPTPIKGRSGDVRLDASLNLTIGEREQPRIKKRWISVVKRRTFRVFLLAFFVWFNILLNQVFSDTLEIDISSQTVELNRIKKELDEKRRSMGILNQKEKSTFEELLDLEERLDLAQKLKRRLAAEEKKVERELKIQEKNSGEADSKLSFYRESSRRRLREIYKHKRFGPYSMLLKASSPVDLINRLNLTKMILKEDRDLLRDTRNLKAELEEEKQNLQKTKSGLTELRKIKAEEEKARKEELGEKERLLKKIKSEKKLYAQAIMELEKNASLLENIWAQIHPPNLSVPSITMPKGEGLFDISKGKMPWPIPGKVIAYFGEQKDPEFETKTENPGIEIAAEAGREVVAVADGRVVYSSRLRGYGNLVILEHDGGYYTVYARLSEISVLPGEEVERLQKIGMVGESGLFASPCLHFEIRKGRQPQNPLEWLR